MPTTQPSLWEKDARGRLDLIEVGPRDGLQNDATMVSTEVKLNMIARSIEAGVKRIEVTSFVSPRLVPALADGVRLLVGQLP